MNNTTLGNSSLPTFSDNILQFLSVVPNLLSLIVRLPANIYIIQLIISSKRITPEFLTLNGAIFELLICIFDLLEVETFFSASEYVYRIRSFFLGFVITGRPFVLALICVDRYLAVVKPVWFLRWKQVKYKIVLCCVMWVWTLLFCTIIIVVCSIFRVAVLIHIATCCVVKLYCCSATLLVLKRPGPGDGARQKEGMNNIKLKAFRIMLVTTVSVIVLYIPTVIVLFLKKYLGSDLFLKIMNACFTCTSLSGCVQALLFLHRSGKMPFIKCP